MQISDLLPLLKFQKFKTEIEQSPSYHSDLGETKNLVINGQNLVFPEFW